MKKEFSFYEFVGILVPSTVLLFFSNEILIIAFQKGVFDFDKIGDSLVFVIIAYGLGHILHALGNILESIVWKVFNGWPTNWLTKKPRFGQSLLEEDDSTKVQTKIYQKFGETKGKDYGRLIYTHLFAKGLTARIDIFNGNYSLFRGMTVSFLLLSAIALVFVGWVYMLVAVVLALLSLSRMVRFAKYYAKEIYRTYLVTDS